MPKLKHQLSVEADEKAKKALAESYEAYLAILLKQKKITPEEANQYKNKAQDKDNRQLTFLSKADGDDFCRKRAEAGHAFLGCWADANGNPTGEYNFSNGDGKLYQGKMSPETIADLRKHSKAILSNPETRSKVEAALMKNDEDSLKDLLRPLKNSSNTLRAGLAGLRSSASSSLAPLPDANKPDADEEAVRPSSSR